MFQTKTQNHSQKMEGDNKCCPFIYSKLKCSFLNSNDLGSFNFLLNTFLFHQNKPLNIFNTK